jgi:hypothetical protein
MEGDTGIDQNIFLLQQRCKPDNNPVHASWYFTATHHELGVEWVRIMLRRDSALTQQICRNWMFSKVPVWPSVSDFRVPTVLGSTRKVGFWVYDKRLRRNNFFLSDY